MKRSISHLWWLPLGILLLAVVVVANARFGAGTETASPTSANESVLPIALDADEGPPVTPMLLQRLAATARAVTDSMFWIVAQVEFPHHIDGVFTNPDSAWERVGGLEGYWAYGPYMQVVSGEALGFACCPHNTITTEPDGIMNNVCEDVTGIPRLPIDSVASVVIEVRTRAGATYSWRFSPSDYDLLFFTYGAFEKFLEPYYVGRSGIGYAQQMSDTMKAIFAGTRN